MKYDCCQFGMPWIKQEGMPFFGDVGDPRVYVTDLQNHITIHLPRGESVETRKRLIEWIGRGMADVFEPKGQE